ncbi:MAG: MFS transporter [Acetobacteraceae bacterium]|nr:MFS transporter [Acetobacteraceae bacterium]
MIAALARRLPFFYGWVVVGVAFMTMAIAVNARTAFSLLFPAILDEFGWDRAVTAGAFSFGFLVSAFLSPAIGRLMDRRGPVWVMEIGVLVSVAGLGLATLAQAPWQLYGSLGVLLGSGAMMLGYTGQALYLPHWFLRQRGLAISIAYAGAGAGSIVLLPLVQVLIELHGWRSACLALAGLILVVLAPLNLLLRRAPQEIGLTPDGDSAVQALAGKSVHVVDHAWAAIDWTLARAMRTTKFWWIAIGNFGALFAWYGVQVHQTKYLVEIGFSSSTAAWALGLVSLVGVPGQIAMGALSDRIGREPVWMLGCGGFLLAYLLLIALGAWPGMVLLALMVLAQGLLGYSLTSVLSPIAAEIFEGRHFGTIFGMLMLAAISGGAAGPFVVGLLRDQTGSDVAGFLAGATASIVAGAAIWLAAPRKVRRVGKNVLF